MSGVMSRHYICRMRWQLQM